MSTQKIVFNPAGSTSVVPCIAMDLCPEALLATCNIPDQARVNLMNSTPVTIIGEQVFVRGVNSNFIPIKTERGGKYYVHERFVRE